MIEYLWEWLTTNISELWEFLSTNYDPLWDTIDLVVVWIGIYWLLVLMRGTRAVQVLTGLGALLTLRLVSDFLELQTLSYIFDTLFQPFVIIIIILFADDIRRALARMGRGFVARLSERQESQILEEIVRACQMLRRRRVGALIVMERETSLGDHVQAGTPLDAAVSKELLASLFQTTSPLHDGAVIVQAGRVAYAGCILPLTLRADLPDGLGTRHRAAVGITEETDAVVIVVSEETAEISVVMGGEMTGGLDVPELRVALRDFLSRGPGELPDEIAPEAEEESSAAPAADDDAKAPDALGTR
jgi:diadenylate cyclase